MIISASHIDGFLGVVWYDAECDRCGRQVTDIDSSLTIDTTAGTVIAIHKNAQICADNGYSVKLDGDSE